MTQLSDSTCPSRSDHLLVARTTALAGALFAVSALLLGGCATSGKPQSNDVLIPGGAVDKLMTDEFVADLSQRYEPLTTTFQVSRNTRDPVTLQLVAELVQLGFGIQRVPQDQGARYIDHQREIILPSNGGTEIRDRLMIGDFDATRTVFLADSGHISHQNPNTSGSTGASSRQAAAAANAKASNLMATSVTASAANAGSERLSEAGGTPSADVREANRQVQAWPESGDDPLIKWLTPTVIENAAARAASASSTQASTTSSAGTALATARTDQGDERRTVNNLFYGGESAFVSRLDGYESVDTQTIVFSNDSMRLGKRNKRLVRRLIDSTLEQDDLISLVGCSTGYTALEIGNEGLALGRAERVLDELMAGGIARERILDEGCWAPVSAGAAFPGRGVVIEVWRPTA